MLTLTGVVLGTKTLQRKRSDGSLFDVQFLGIQTDKESGYDGETITTDIQISQHQYQAGICAFYQKLRGQVVSVPVWVTAWAGKNNNAGINFHLSGEGKPVSGQPPVCVPTAKAV